MGFIPLQVLIIEQHGSKTCPSCRTVLTPLSSDVFFVLCAIQRICETTTYESAKCCVCSRAPPAVTPCAFVLDVAINSDYFAKLY